MKKAILIGISIVFVALVAVHFGGLHFAKNWLNDNSKDLLGRKLQIHSVGLNYPTAAVTVNGITLFESDDQTSFVSIKEVFVNIDLWSLLGDKGYVVEKVIVDGLDGNVVLDGESFNFDDMIAHFTPTEKEEPEEEKEPVKWYVQSIELSNSSLSYHDLKIGEDLSIHDLNVSLPEGIAWDALGVEAEVDLSLERGGTLVADIAFDNDYTAFAANIQLMELNNRMLLPYVQDFLKISDMRGSISLDLHAAGSLENTLDVNLNGVSQIDSSALYDLNGEKLFGIGGLTLVIDSINPAHHIYAVHSLTINEPYGWFQLYEDGNNLSQLLRDSVSQPVDSADAPTVVEPDHSSNVFLMIGEYGKQAVKDIQVSDFKLDTLAISGLSFDFEDHTMLLPFNYSTSEVSLHSYGISSAVDSVVLTSAAKMNGTGQLDLRSKVNPINHEDLLVNMTLEGLVMEDVSPYFHQYLAHRIENGMLNFSADVDIKSGVLKSLLALRIDSLEISEKEMHDEAFDLPVKLAVKVLNGRSGIIDLEIPVEGNLKDPEYKLGKAVWKVFKNLIVKSGTPPPPDTTKVDSISIPQLDSLVVPLDTIPIGIDTVALPVVPSDTITD